MIQRALLRNSRSSAARSWKSLTSSSASLPTQSPFPSRLPKLRQSYEATPSSAYTLLTSRRSYSTEPTKPTSDSADEASPSSAPSSDEPSPPDADPLRKELELKNKEIIELKDKYLRSVADFRNLQDRTKRDVQAARDFAIQRFGRDLVESIDNLDRALTMVPAEALTPASSESATAGDSPSAGNKDLVNLYDGLKMTENILMSTLKKHGLERFDPAEGEGQKFDPNLHEATFQTKVEGKEEGTVFMTQQKGFLLNGRVLRAAKVGVVKNS